MDVAIDGIGGKYVNFIQREGNNQIVIPQTEALLFFNRYTTRFGDYIGNTLGLYSIGSVGRNGEAIIGKLGSGDFIIQPRGQGCSWDPMKGMTGDFETIQTHQWKVNLENCPDTLWYSFLERLLDVGNGVIDWESSVESQAMLQNIITQMYNSMGNSFAMLAAFGKNAMANYAEANETWIGEVESQKFQKFMKTISVHMGHYTYMDKYQEEGPENFSVTLPREDFSTDGTKMISGAKAFVDRLINDGSSDFALINDQMVANGVYPVIKLSPAIFNRFVEENNFGYFAHMTEKVQDLYHTGTSAEYKITPFTYLYKGYYVCKDNMQGQFDKLTGTITHRGFCSIAGNLGIITDIGFIPGYDGAGMRFYQDMHPKNAGMIYVDGFAKSNTAILDTELITHGSYSPQLV